MKYYIPCYYGGREKYEYFATILGMFKTEVEAVQALFDLLVTKECICRHCGECSDESDEEDEEDENMHELKIAKIRSQTTTSKELEDVSKKFGDSYYKEGWEWKIEKFDV